MRNSAKCPEASCSALLLTLHVVVMIKKMIEEHVRTELSKNQRTKKQK